MKVLHLISSGGMYGAEAVILNLCHELRRQGHESSIAVFANASQQLHERALAEGLTSVLIPCDGLVSPKSVRAIRNVTRQQGIDVLHAHGYKADLYAWAALRSAGVPLVSTCHTWYDNDFALRLYGALDRWVLRSYARVVAVSAEVERRLLESGVAADRIRSIRNGIDLRPFSPAAGARMGDSIPRMLQAGLVGRLSPEKGVDIFIEAAAIVARSFANARFAVFGDGPDRSQLEQQVRTLNMEEKIVLAGRQDSMLKAYAGLDVLVSASRQEGLPMALLEGMASGLPVVGTTAGEVPTLVRPGETGLLVAPGDAAALAAAMLDLLEDHAQRLQLGRGAHALVEREFSAERMTAEYLAVYGEAMGKGTDR